MVATPRRTAAAIAVAFALAALPCASKAQIIIDQCLLHGGRLIVNASPGNSAFPLSSGSISYGCEVVGDASGDYRITGTLNAGAISSGAGSSVLDVAGGTVNYTSILVGQLSIAAGPGDAATFCNL